MFREAARDILVISLAAALGALSRYWLTRYSVRFFGSQLPVGTLAVNLIGCLLIGILYTKRQNLPPWLGLALITGFLGSFTTFSSFALDSWKLHLNHQPIKSFLYVLLSVGGGFWAVWIGMQIPKLKL